MFRVFYAAPIPFAVFFSLGCLAVWALVSVLFLKFGKERYFRIFCIICVAASLILIFVLGIYGRDAGEEYRPFYFDPFRLFYEARIQKESYRSMLMNLLMFLPLGVSLPFALSLKKPLGTVLLSVAIGFLLSTLIEALQFIFQIGQGESADILCNTVGMIIGTVPYIIHSVYAKRKNCLNL